MLYLVLISLAEDNRKEDVNDAVGTIYRLRMWGHSHEVMTAWQGNEETEIFQ